MIDQPELNPDPPTPPGMPELPSLDGRVALITAEYTQARTKVATEDDGLVVMEPPD